jgi:hypothetical protein
MAYSLNSPQKKPVLVYWLESNLKRETAFYSIKKLIAKAKPFILPGAVVEVGA